MAGVDGADADDRAQVGHRTLAMVEALHANLEDSLRAVAWYGEADQGLLYAHSDVEGAITRLGEALDRRPVADGAFEYAIDAYEGMVIVTLSSRTLSSTSGVNGVAIAVERDASLEEITVAIERAVAASRR